ncbi:hypothetical protein LK09_09625 [Microbacterium mangrovi]|uniref:Uncharacterized protein n=1 Tax=Microbacterium mangrovi TaxID=1348253 RepID=A0A0B2A7T1_9MICO|nr:hypothetical protein LK09_09625 [Microbacterium mangrovi]
MNGQLAPQRRRTTAATGVAARMVLAWVDCYTSGVSTQAAERRRAEIHSDLWEQQADARANGRPPSAVSLSIARRAVFGAPADLLWVRKQRAASRGLPTEQKARSMNIATRLIVRWWWAFGAALLAAWGLTQSIGQLLEPGMPYLAGTIQGLTVSTLLIAGIALRRWMPRTAAALVVAGGATFAMLTWAPVVMAIGILVVLGAGAEVVRLTAQGDPGRVAAVVGGLIAIGATPIGYAVAGHDAGAVGLLWFALGAAGVALLIAAGAHRTTGMRAA